VLRSLENVHHILVLSHESVIGLDELCLHGKVVSIGVCAVASEFNELVTEDAVELDA